MGLVKEFKEFALKGNMVDMAVGIIIGGAFGLIVKSVISDLIMPVVGIFGEADFTNMYYGLTEEVRNARDAANEAGNPLGLEEAREIGPVLAYGNFATGLINFLILALVIFIMIKMMNNAKKKFEKEQVEGPPPAPAEDIVLLREIRDSLQKS